MTIKYNFYRIIIKSNSQMVINVFMRRSLFRQIVNLLEDVINICTFLKEININYYAKECKRQTNKMTKSTHKQLM